MVNIQVAAQIFDQKVNYEYPFAELPTIPDLIQIIEESFSDKIELDRPENVPPHPFKVSKLKLYDENKGKWAELVNPSLLSDGCQLYAFQAENPWHKESQKELPASVRAPVSLANEKSAILNSTNGSIANHSTNSLVGMSVESNKSTKTLPKAFEIIGFRATNVPIEDKIKAIFAEFDVNRVGYLTHTDIITGYQTMGFGFTNATMDDLFQKCDDDMSGRVNIFNFVNFCKLYPIMTDCLYFRTKAFWDEDSVVRGASLAKKTLKDALRQLEEAEKKCNNSQKKVDDAVKTVADVDNALRELGNQHNNVTEEIEAAKQEREKAARQKKDHDDEITMLRDQERRLKDAHSNILNDLKRSETKVTTTRNEVTKAEEHLRQVQAALVEAQKSVDECIINMNSAQVEHDRVISMEQSTLADLDRVANDIRPIENAVNNTGNSIQSVSNRVRDLCDFQKDIQQKNEETLKRREAVDRALKSTKDSHQRITDDLDKIRALIVDREKNLASFEADLSELRRERQQVTPNESAMIEQEIRLREQRDSLEQKESKLKSDADQYLSKLCSTLSSRSRSFSRERGTVPQGQEEYNRRSSKQ